MQIYKANLDDLQSLVDLEYSLFNCDQISKRQFRYNIKKQKLFFVAKISDQLAGYILCFEYKKSIRVYSLAVTKKFQGKGIGKNLLNYLITNSKKNIYLEVNVNNSNAIALYQKLSFAIYKTIPKYYQSGDSAYRMVLRKI
ncbi:GNAT family N-acetyltransferase [Allofrancisella guangzhouensis]|uniref:Acetyltransferase n=1 Tax=Allofrancisella guangzhouensis TaxID=594679 RepID=A0A0A8E8E0_9GAMM|nr:GNAT family N-acetyltransferase [Allofrancisella guangzhouensis]AJC48416.1 acetyltransferase [Allofrancisella guangzhouensis]MBK2027307.1 GNAT family N-acetyltransferase [Allofrancisella guangzhouensis]MBK2043537.1 GNAT family N-acetyltransferase [Allofrancisella guangzhouensis]MBK2045469.1 GNAT family N-acetyltransferase [Allofrancisella guangzhouensis]